MANPYVVDFGPVNNALAAWAKGKQFDQQMTESQRQFNAQNYFAQGRFDLDKQRFAQDQKMAPMKLDLLKAQIDAAKRQGATEAQLAPLKIELMRAQTGLAQAQAGQATAKGAMLNSLFAPPQTQPQAPANGFQPQSFEGQGSDPMLIPTQAGGPAVPQEQPDLVPTPFGPMTIEDAQKRAIGLGAAGMGDAGKIFMDAANANKLDKTARGEVEKDLVGLTGTIGRLESISKRFDPKFLNIPERAGMAWAGLQDKFGSLKPETKADLARYTKFRQTSVNNAALYVKYLSGVAVSEQEFARIMKTLPNAGTGIFDGDSPTEFKAKMDEATTQAKMAYARAMYLRTQGFKGKPWEAGVALDDMGDIIRQRGAQLQQELQGRVAPDRMQTTVRQKLKQEFGI